MSGSALGGHEEGDAALGWAWDYTKPLFASTTQTRRASRTQRIRPRRRRSAPRTASAVASTLLLTSLPTSLAQACISLKGSTQCSAFNASSISTDSANVGLFPFLSSVTDLATFDSGLQTYIGNGFAQIQYQQLLGCSTFNADNTTDFYARYTTSVLCNAIIQNSVQACSLAGNAARPLCAESCAEYAESEQQITESNVCGSPGSNALTQIRADFTNCALPANSLTEQCIQAVQNQPNNCGFASNTASLCSYCAASSPNATDSCCVFSNSETRCKGVVLPIVASSSLRPITVTASSTSSTGTSTTAPTTAGSSSSRGLTGGQIAGIVVGSVLGALLLLALIIGGCLLLKRRRETPPTSIFNQPTPARQQPPMSSHDGSRDQERGGITALPPARVARMSALEATGAGSRKYAGGFRFSEEDSPEGGFDPAPPLKRSGSFPGDDQLAVVGGAAQDTSPSTNNEESTPESHAQSEQLGFFKDYYSQDEIHPGDLVATLWAYEPRAADEFHLERGDMIKVIGIWDDGWATGVRVRQKAEDWRPDDKVLRDSGLSNDNAGATDAADGGEVKAFPLVCVCLPQHWKKTIEGESTEGSGPPDIP
ncbi:hypothetical protein BDY17DRAFT_23507 [Neohortaea acidophila]|uniref:SH3 domain-containing protein n=1 Tax=Neohortaea acidophila TaxID=245834 RepID=A0A6A6Q6K8_9PEZI|nr:uncharacterized protein BDY17DRAFT_23507 [Neohortaea acidophila]KAF2488078.1 hypothetical protein BDY17DRAFT_23507 [Neohortaea acidophila]